MATHPAPARTQPVRSSIAGTWRNELGSELELHDTDGFLSGRYRSAVGTVRDARPLIGICTPPTGTGPVVLAFVVCWSDSGSVTSWTGRYDIDEDALHMTWILQAATAPETAWSSTQLGQDEFRRVAPSAAHGIPAVRAVTGAPDVTAR